MCSSSHPIEDTVADLAAPSAYKKPSRNARSGHYQMCIGYGITTPPKSFHASLKLFRAETDRLSEGVVVRLRVLLADYAPVPCDMTHKQRVRRVTALRHRVERGRGSDDAAKGKLLRRRCAVG